MKTRSEIEIEVVIEVVREMNDLQENATEQEVTLRLAFALGVMMSKLVDARFQIQNLTQSQDVKSA